MRWPSNPFSRSQVPAPAPEDPETAIPREVIQQQQGLNSSFQSPTKRFTAHQIFYIFGLDGIGALLLSGGINFAIAYAMYTTQDIERNPIRLFELPNTLAGDAAVTIIVQCIITWLIEFLLVNYDLKGGHVHPIGFIPEPANPLVRWFLFLDPQDADADSKPSPIERGRLARGAFFIFSHALRGFIVAFFSFCLLWGPSVGILTAVGTKRGGDWYYEQKWAPEIFKLVLGGVLGLLVTPPFAMFWLVKCGWTLQAQENSSREEPPP